MGKMSRLQSVLVFIYIFIVFIPFFNLRPHVANDYLFATSDNLKNSFNLPYAWNSSGSNGLGEYAIPTLWGWPIDLSYGILGSLGLTFPLVERLLGVAAPVLIGLLGIRKLLNYFGINGWASTFAELFFISNPYFLLLIDGGQLSLALAYALLPLVFFLYRKTVEIFKLKKIIQFILALLLLSIADFRIIFMLAVLIIVNTILETITLKRIIDFKVIFKQRLLLAIISGLFLGGFHSYWILPGVKDRLPSLPATYQDPSQVDFLSLSDLGHAIFTVSPHWFSNTFGRVEVVPYLFFLIPILVFIAPILKKNVWIAYWLSIAIMGIFLSKGSNPPFPGVYKWLFVTIPGFSLFRDPVKFFFLISISYTLLMAFSLNTITTWLKSKPSFSKLTSQIIGTIFCLYLILLVSPTFLGKMTGLFSDPFLLNNYLKSFVVFQKDFNYSGILWVPSRPSMSFSSSLHPVFESARLLKLRPFSIAQVGTYESDNFLREGGFIGELLNITGIGYIVYPPLDPRRDDMSSDNVKYHQTFFNQLKSKPWVKEDLSSEGIPILKLQANQPQLFALPNVWMVVGSAQIYNESTKSADLKLTNNGLIFAEEFPELASQILKYPFVKIVLYQKDMIDLAATLIPQNNFIYPANFLENSPNQTGWWKRGTGDLINWRDFLQTKYGVDNLDFDYQAGWAISEGSNEIKIPGNFKQGDTLLIRAMESSRSGSLKFIQDGKLVGSIQTKNKTNGVRWFNVGNLFSSHQIQVESSGDINAVNILATLDSKAWVMYQAKANGLQNQIVNFYPNQVLFSKPEISFVKVNPTLYQIHINNVGKGALLVLSQSYDKLWELSNDQPVPVYSILNGYLVTKDGDYLLNYKAQDDVYIGLTISFATLVILFAMLVISFKRA